MSYFESLFTDSAKNLKSVNKLTTIALLTACAVAVSYIKIPVATPNLQIRFDFIFLALVGWLFGPVSCALSAIVSDVGGYLINPLGGAFFIGYTIAKVISALIYGICLYKKDQIAESFVKWTILSKTLVTVLVNIIINSYCMVLTGIYSYQSLFAGPIYLRISKNLILLPLEIIILFYVMRVIRPYAAKLKLLDGAKNDAARS